MIKITIIIIIIIIIININRAIEKKQKENVFEVKKVF